MKQCCFCQEYLLPHDNQYYNEFGKELNIESRILMETENWYAVPSLGCLTVGYILLVCKHHLNSLANVNHTLFVEMLHLKQLIENEIFLKLGCECISFEHGVTDPSYTGANSVDHIHLHIVPCSKRLWNDIAQTHDLHDFWVFHDHIALFESWRMNPPHSYLLFQDLDKNIYYIQDASGFQSQFFRQCLSEIIGLEQWDWKKENYNGNFIKTLELFS